MNFDEHDDQLRELLVDFEDALRSHLKTSEQFNSLVEYLTKKHGAISLYVAAQIMGAHIGAQTRKRRVKKKPAPVSFEITKNDLDFLRSLKISTNI